jgi:hypothetical protein
MDQVARPKKNSTEQTLKISFLPLGEQMPPPSPPKDQWLIDDNY